MNVCTINQTAVTPPWGSPEVILAGVAYAANLLFGLPINGYVAWLIVSGQQEKIASDFIPLNQIAVESFLCLSGILYFIRDCSIFANVFHFFFLIFVLMRPMMQSYLCLEHYLATVHPVVFLWCKPLRYKVAVCCVSWLIAVTLSIVAMALNRPRTFGFVTAAYDLFFLLLMTFCGVSVLRALKRPSPGEGRKDQHRGNSMKKKAFKIILINLVSTTLSQLPLPVTVSLEKILPASQFPALYSINISIFVMTGFVPSMVYLYRVGKLFSKCNCL